MLSRFGLCYSKEGKLNWRLKATSHMRRQHQFIGIGSSFKKQKRVRISLQAQVLLVDLDYCQATTALTIALHQDQLAFPYKAPRANFINKKLMSVIILKLFWEICDTATVRSSGNESLPARVAVMNCRTPSPCRTIFGGFMPFKLDSKSCSPPLLTCTSYKKITTKCHNNDDKDTYNVVACGKSS